MLKSLWLVSYINYSVEKFNQLVGQADVTRDREFVQFDHGFYM